MPGKKVSFVDSTLRDGQETLLGGRLRTQLIPPILKSLDEAGFQAIEAWGGGTFRASLALLHEDPWERLRILKKGLKRTPIQMLLRGRFLVGDRPYSYGFVKRFLSHAAELGVEVVRLLDPLNNFESLTKVAKLATRAGFTVQVSVLCSEVRNNLSYYRSLIDSDSLPDADAIGIFDPWGTLHPAMVATLVELLVKRGGKRVFAHLHNLGGAGILCSSVAKEKGASIVDSCFGAFASDGSLPSIEVLVRALDAQGFLAGLNLVALSETSRAFQRLRSEFFDRVPAMMQPITPLERNLQNIRPTSNSMLKDEISAPQNAADKPREETAEVLNDLGLAALAAPISEMVARQVVLNLHSKNRYNQLTDEFLALLRGKFGPVKLSSRLKDNLKNNVSWQREDFREEPDEQVVKPINRPKLREGDLLSFVIYPQEFSEMFEVRDSGVGDEREKIVAAALAVLAEEDRTKRSTGKLALELKTQAKSASWRYPSWFEDSYSMPKRGFIQEPF